MDIRHVKTGPIEGQKPGTGGLRKRTEDFMAPNFLENFLQSCINVRKRLGHRLDSLVIGGDGRYPGAEFLPCIVRLLVANGVKKILVVGEPGSLAATTPAISHVIRKYGADGGFILSASHNPGGPNGDFGIKVELAGGGGAPEAVTDAIYGETKSISEYLVADGGVEGFVEYVDPVADYVDMLGGMFDFDAIKGWFDAGHTFRYDGMNAASGPVARAIFRDLLDVPEEWLLRCDPMPDFGGIHPEPNPTYGRDLFDLMMKGDIDFAAAEDGDGDRNMVLGRRFYLAPSDCLAIMAKYRRLVPYFRKGFKGAARTLPTSSALDLVAAREGFGVYATPTGWKWFASLLDAGMISLCGEESFGQGGDYIREKDGMFAVLYWLNVMGATGLSLEELASEMWEENGRVFYSQYSYEGVDKAGADRLVGFAAKNFEAFDYTDPATGEIAKSQGFQTEVGGVRVFFRLSGTGTVGATLRFYIEKLEGDRSKFGLTAREYLKDAYGAVADIFRLKEFFGKDIVPSAIN
ncbi:MAG: alpha-D-glucose phosphate-specific phosphoglucomutase [Rickettsiales bacterium]|jgi:phosphoglucomutase|nr:alpha-D-glucose phosphate-specific phosphoglucomutase [Rickettsiales bacterium]